MIGEVQEKGNEMKVGDRIYTDDAVASYEATEADVLAYEKRAARLASAQSPQPAADAPSPEAVAALIKAAEDATVWLRDLNTVSGDTVRMRLEMAIEAARPKTPVQAMNESLKAFEETMAPVIQRIDEAHEAQKAEDPDDRSDLGM